MCHKCIAIVPQICYIIYNETKGGIKKMEKCYHVMDQDLIYEEEKEKPDGTLFLLETYECGECGEEYTVIKEI